MKFRLVLIAVAVTLLLIVLAMAVMAQEEPPAPYAGMQNPFPWSDTSVQQSGKGIYQRSCLGCHGVDGGNIAQSDFNALDFPQSLEGRPDFYFWVLSEGRLDKGMPPFKSSLSEEQRWQVLTYIWSLGAAAPPEKTPPPTEPPAEVVGGTLRLTAPEQAQSGQPVTLSAVLQDSQGKPIGGAKVKFFIGVDFFTTDLMEIGEELTNDQGVAVFEYTPRQTGEIQVVARYEAIEGAARLTVAESDTRFYHPEAGLQLPAPGEEVLVGPKSAVELEHGSAPMTAFRLPGGILSWLLLLVVIVMMIWLTYFRVIYQVFRIPIRREIGDTDTRRIPLTVLAIVTVFGILLVLLLITGPHSHLHLFR